MKPMAFKKQKRKGFIFLILLFLITMVGLCMAILTGISNGLVTDTNTAYLNACQKNMIKSAAAFSMQNSNTPADQPIELNISELGKSCESLTIISRTAPQPTLEIKGTCRVARHKITIKETLKITTD